MKATSVPKASVGGLWGKRLSRRGRVSRWPTSKISLFLCGVGRCENKAMEKCHDPRLSDLSDTRARCGPFSLSSAIRILREYQRGVVFTLGRFTGVKGPGLIILIPFVQQMVKVDLRVKVQDVPPQDVISRDNVSVKVNAVLYFRIVDAERAIIRVEDFMAATSQLAQTTLRSVLGKHELDEMLAERDRLNSDIQEISTSRPMPGASR